MTDALYIYGVAAFIISFFGYCVIWDGADTADRKRVAARLTLLAPLAAPLAPAILSAVGLALTARGVLTLARLAFHREPDDPDPSRGPYR